MALNEILRDGDHVSLPVKAGVKPGDPVRVGKLNGVAQTARGEGGNPNTHATVWLKGVFQLPVTGAVAEVGAPIYFTESGLNVEGTDVFGAALETQTEDGTIAVRILAQS